MNETDFIFKASAAFNGWQFLNIALQTMPTDWNLPFCFRARLSFFGQTVFFQNQRDRAAIGK
jgi:hypothetical protein